jgi:hypothetical protein
MLSAGAIRASRGNAHDPTEWKNNLWFFAQRIFR